MAKSRNRKLADLIVTAGVDIAGNVTFDGGSTSADLTFADGDKANFGASSDLQIYHDGFNNYIQGQTGSTIIQNALDNYHVIIKSDNGSGGLADYFRAKGDTGAALMYHYGSEKLATTSYGADITGRLVTTSHIDAPDNARIRLGDGDDLQIYHDGSDSFIDDAGTGALAIRSNSINLQKYTGETMAVFTADGSVQLNYDNGKRLETTSAGVDVTGTLGVNNTIDIRSGSSIHGSITTSSSSLTLNARNTGHLIFQSGGAEKMRLANGGNVGIGTTSPDTNLHVYKASAGSITASSDAQLVVENSGVAAINLLSGTSSHGQILFGDSGDADDGQFGYDQTNREFYFKTAGNSTKRLLIDSSGNVGIGTTSPALGLHVVGAVRVDNNEGVATRKIRSNYFSNGQNLTLASGTSANIIMETTNVGIGTASPDAKLHVQSTGSDGVIVRTTTNVEPFIALQRNSGSNGVAVLRSIDGGDLRIDTGATGAAQVTKMTIEAGGNVGIGTASPDYLLDIENTSGHAMARLHSGTNGSSSLRLQNDAQHWDVNLQTNDKFAVYDHTAGTQPFTIMPTTGNVGIGNPSPSARLHVKSGGTGNVFYVESSDGHHLGGFYQESDTRAAFNVRNASGSAKVNLDSGGNSWFAGGNVGIGDTTPQALLDVGGGYGGNTTVATFAHATDAYIEIENMTTQNGAGIILTNAGTKKWTIQKDTSAHGLYIQDASTNANMTFLQGGNVGIGTTSPDAKLDIEGTLTAPPSIRLTQTGNLSQNDVTGKIEFYNSDTTDNTAGVFGIIQGVAGPSGGEGSLQFLVDMPSEGADANNVAMHINANGNVGIGTTSPTAPLQLNTAGNTADGTYYSTFTINNTGSSTWSRLRFDRSGVAKWGLSLGTDDKFKISNLFTAGSASSPDDNVLVIDNDSNVGIGTASPGCALDIERSSGWSEVHLNGATGGDLILQDNGVNIGEVYAGVGHGMVVKAHSGQHLFFLSGGVATPRMSLNSNGDIVIGDSSKLQKNYRTWYSGSSTSVQYIKIYSRTGNSGNVVLRFQMYAYNHSEHSVEVKIKIPTYSGFLTNYGAFDAGQGPDVEIIAGGLTSQSNIFKEIIAVADMSSSSGSDSTEIWLKIQPPHATTVIKVAEFAESEHIQGGTSDWTTTAPSNIQKTYPINVGHHSINNIHIGQDENVGIGTTAPAGPLHVDGHTGSLATILEGNGNGDTVPLHFRVKANNNNVTNHGIFGNAGSTGADNSIHIGPSNTSGLSVNAAGNVGIGTASPASKLHIRTSTNNNYEFEEVSGELRFSALNDARSANVPLQFAASEFNFISGNVGIGTTDPNAKLHVYDAGGNDPTVRVRRGLDGGRIQFVYASNTTTGLGEIGQTYYGTGRTRIWMGANLESFSTGHSGPAQQDSSYGSWFSTWDSYADEFTVNRIASGTTTEVLTLNYLGRLGVGTSNPTQKLEVAGGLKFNQFSAGHGLNVVSYQTFNNTNTYNACGSVYYSMFVVNIYHNNGHSQCFFVANGGGGVGYNFTGIVPGNTNLITGTGINTSFTTIGSSPNTFTINISSGGGALSVRRTNGTGSFGISVHKLAGG